jgi:hypothetical protein
MALTDKQEQALSMKRSGMKLREIGTNLKVGVARAHRLISRATQVEKQREWTRGLAPAVAAALLASGVSCFSALKSAADDGSLRRMPGIGPRRYAAILTWLQRQ